MIISPHNTGNFFLGKSWSEFTLLEKITVIDNFEFIKLFCSTCLLNSGIIFKYFWHYSTFLKSQFIGLNSNLLQFTNGNLGLFRSYSLIKRIYLV
jgi:hypothetical protein